LAGLVPGRNRSPCAWPSGLADAVTDPQLLAGFNPDGVGFDPSRWATLRVE
jgi:hypothetical protein